MSTIYYSYKQLELKYDKLLSNYADLLSRYKQLDRLYYSNSDKLVEKLLYYFECKNSNNLSDSSEQDYFCPHINNYCLYAGTDYCFNLCNRRFR